MKRFFVLVSGLVFLVNTGLHAYRANVGIPVTVGTFVVPIAANWVCRGVASLLGLGLLIFGRQDWRPST